MAYINTEYCPKCESETRHTNGKCNDCAAREYREQTAAWNALTTEEKMQDLRRRVERMERGPITY